MRLGMLFKKARQAGSGKTCCQEVEKEVEEEKDEIECK
jgi:hypothetical protein